MNPIVVKPVTEALLHDFTTLCISGSKQPGEVYLRGAREMTDWATAMLRRFGMVGKLAFLDGKPAGILVCRPEPEQQVLRIKCIFVPDEKQTGKGLGKALWLSLLAESRLPHPVFGGKPPRALVVRAFANPAHLTQPVFFRNLGFVEVPGPDTDLLYYPLEPGYVYQPSPEKGYAPSPEDRGCARVRYDPACPHCLFFAEQSRKMLEETVPGIPVTVVNKFQEGETTGQSLELPPCVVNGQPIAATLWDPGFREEAKQAWNSGPS